MVGQAFLAGTVETGDKNEWQLSSYANESRDGHEVFFLVMTEMMHVSWSRFRCLAMM